MQAPPAGQEIWREPARGASFPRELLGLPGIAQLRSLLTGRVAPPPIAHLVGMRPTEVGSGSATFVMPITAWLQTPQGIATAGEVAILADGPLGCAIQSVLPAATGYTTTELSINLVRPVPREGQLVARGRLVHGGRRLALSEVFVTDDNGRLIAHGTSRCVLFPPAGEISPPSVEISDPPPAPAGWVPPYRRPPQGAVLDQEIWEQRSGLDIVRAHIAGELPAPPISHLLGAVPVEADQGRCSFSMPASEWLISPLGMVEGGVTACLADFAMAAAVQTTVPAGTAYAPTDLRVQFIRPVPPDGRSVTATARVVHRGRSLAVARAEVTDQDGRLVALATGSALILPGRRADLADSPSLG